MNEPEQIPDVRTIPRPRRKVKYYRGASRRGSATRGVTRSSAFGPALVTLALIGLTIVGFLVTKNVAFAGVGLWLGGSVLGLALLYGVIVLAIRNSRR